MIENGRIGVTDFLGMGMSSVGATVARNHHRIIIDMIDGFFASGSMSTSGALTLSRSMTEKLVNMLSERKLSNVSVSAIQKELMSG